MDAGRGGGGAVSAGVSTISRGSGRGAGGETGGDAGRHAVVGWAWTADGADCPWTAIDAAWLSYTGCTSTVVTRGRGNFRSAMCGVGAAAWRYDSRKRSVP